jgi:hypothetical protein
LTPSPWSRLGPGKDKPGLSDFLKNNTKHQPAWQEIVDFSYQASWPPTGRIRRSLGTPRDLINRIPYQWREDHPLIAGCALSLISDFSM